MSYDDSRCVCGGQKPPGTMLCDACDKRLAHHPCMATYRDPLASVPARRSAAIALLGAARRQKRLTLLNSYQVYA